VPKGAAESRRKPTKGDKRPWWEITLEDVDVPGVDLDAVAAKTGRELERLVERNSLKLKDLYGEVVLRYNGLKTENRPKRRRLPGG